jgi:outer membrane protein OmpA-like peptidoglycan-associated protein
MSLRRVAGGTLLAVGLATTMCVGTYWTAQAMQADLTDQARIALEARHLTATVAFSGRDAYVWAETPTARADAVAAVRTVPGVRTVLVGAGAPPVSTQPSASAGVTPRTPTPAAPSTTSSPATTIPSAATTSAAPSMTAAAPSSTPTASVTSIAPLTIPIWPAIPFNGSSPYVAASATAALVQIAQFMVVHPTTIVTLTGYTDMSLTEADRQSLGLARARSAASVLTANGVSPARITMKSRGGNDPVAGNTSAQGRALNQRVNVTMTQEN